MKNLQSSWYCHYKDVGTKNGWELYKVEQLNKNNDLKTEFEVEIKLPTNDVKCTCEHFNFFGTLCRHAFNILMKHGIKEIPEQYIENHWRKDVISRHYHFGRHVYDTRDSEINRSVNQAYYNFEACLKIESMLKEYENGPTNQIQKNRTDVEELTLRTLPPLLRKIIYIEHIKSLLHIRCREMLFIKKKSSLNEQHSSTSKTSSKYLICSMKINFLSNGGSGILRVIYNSSVQENFDFEMPSWNLENLD
uniref:Protein FAR1-RELATED SEQUENCE n=1 Tax=Lactuca sativa TaxID=4236 RepID=A0A9R1XU33_LACSA|nr:hypothetical protein LSAT_V11C100010080 [Lactuca sativa]